MPDKSELLRQRISDAINANQQLRNLITEQHDDYMQFSIMTIYYFKFQKGPIEDQWEQNCTLNWQPKQSNNNSFFLNYSYTVFPSVKMFIKGPQNKSLLNFLFSPLFSLNMQMTSVH